MNWINSRWEAIKNWFDYSQIRAVVVTILIFNAVFFLSTYMISNNQAQRRQDEQIQALRKATDEIIAENKSQTQQLDAENQQLREYGENIICILAILNPGAVPNADPVRCRARVQGINNTDGTFISGSWPPLPPESGSEPTQQPMQPTQNPQQAGLLDRITNRLQRKLP